MEYLIVGLGNPGEEYAHTRHNAGFDAVDVLVSEVRASGWVSKFGALIAQGELSGREVLLAKPQRFMNCSGTPVRQLCEAYGVSPDHIVVIHDEADISSGTVRVKFGGGHAGHNGLKSIEGALGTRDWYRVRTGIGHPPGRMTLYDWVLTRPRADSLEDFEFAVNRAASATAYLLANGLEKTQAEFNRTNTSGTC